MNASSSRSSNLSQRDRYRRHNNEWWYWNDDRTWSYYRDGRWLRYDPNNFRRPAAVQSTPQRRDYDNARFDDRGYRTRSYRNDSRDYGYRDNRNAAYGPYSYRQQSYYYGNQPYGYGNRGYGYGYGGQRYGTGYRGYRGGFYGGSREGRTGAAIGGAIGGREGAAIGGFIGEATRD